MPLLIYTLLRVALVVAVYLVLSFLGFRGWVLLVGALLIAALLSFLILPRQADAAAGLIRRRVGDRVSDRLDRSLSVDDDVEDAATSAPWSAARSTTGDRPQPATALGDHAQTPDAPGDRAETPDAPGVDDQPPTAGRPSP